MKSRLIFSVMFTVFIALFGRMSPLLAQDEPQDPNKVEVKEIFDILGQFFDCKTVYTAGKVVNLADAYSKVPDLYFYNDKVSKGQTPDKKNPILVNVKIDNLLDVFAVTCITASVVIEKFNEPPAP